MLGRRDRQLCDMLFLQRDAASKAHIPENLTQTLQALE